jgi:hypothetical protein
VSNLNLAGNSFRREGLSFPCFTGGGRVFTSAHIQSGKRSFVLIDRIHGYALAFGLVALMSTGCNNRSDTDMSYKAAINDHFKAFPVCIWSQPKKFPVQAATSDDAKREV